MKLAFIGGTGPEGLGLAMRFASAGHQVAIGSRSQERGALRPKADALHRVLVLSQREEGVTGPRLALERSLEEDHLTRLAGLAAAGCYLRAVRVPGQGADGAGGLTQHVGGAGGVWGGRFAVRG